MFKWVLNTIRHEKNSCWDHKVAVFNCFKLLRFKGEAQSMFCSLRKKKHMRNSKSLHSDENK